MMSTFRMIFSWFGVMLCASPVFAASWLEVGAGDAPDGPSLAGQQVTMGVGPLTDIQGSLDGAHGDLVDTFCIRITNFVDFYASTATYLGGSLTRPDERLSDSRMWLWTQSDVLDAASQLLLANDDTIDPAFPMSSDLGSTIAHPLNFGSLTGGLVDLTAINSIPFLLDGQQYLLSISAFPNDPEDAANIDLATLGPAFTSLHGPNPLAGPFEHWENVPNNEVGSYTIALSGTEFCELLPEPSSHYWLPIVVAGFVPWRSRRFRRVRVDTK